MVKGVMTTQLAWAIEDRMDASQAVEILKAAEGGTYKPFMTDTKLRALGMKQSASSSLNTLVSKMGGGTHINMFTQINNQQDKDKPKGISYDDALLIIQEENKKLLPSDNDTLNYLESKYAAELEVLPKIVATEQEGNFDKEGVNLLNHDIKQITDNYKDALEIADTEFEEIQEALEAKWGHHDTRRQKEIDEDLTEDDPELEIYD